MSDSSRDSKVGSVAAFLFMPQISLSWGQFSFIIPVFIRTIAVMFEQSGLLPPNHPASRYGMDGVKKYRFTELLGEAWYHLRTTSATPRQWSLFASVVLMIVFIALSFITTLLNVSGILIGSASAQIFDNPNGVSDTLTVTAAPGFVAGSSFNTVVHPIGTAGAHSDWGIMILDKMLREGVQNVGGTTQNALGALMQMYNTGVLVIAGIILFWIVLSVVVDTAKTGTIGGGRHNMVWAPIRIVFALGLLIPLGTNGFSSGQFCVMKLAECGSNFGTRSWAAYVTAVTNNENIISKYGTMNPTDLMSQYAQMWLCRVSYNGYANQAGALTTEQAITTMNNPNSPIGTSGFYFTNTTAKNLCGSVTYPITTWAEANVATDPNADPLIKAIARYRVLLAAAYYNLFFSSPLGLPFNILWKADDGSLVVNAKNFACSFASQFIYAGVGVTAQPLEYNVGGGLFGIGAINDCNGHLSQCGAGAPGSGQMPDLSCIVNLITTFNDAINPVVDQGVAAVQAASRDPDFRTRTIQQGWPSMGVWYNRIEMGNSALDNLRVTNLTMTKGDLGADTSDLAGKVGQVMSQYRKWWIDAVASARPPVIPSPATAATMQVYTSDDARSNIVTNTSRPDLTNVLSGAQDASPGGFAADIFKMAQGDWLGIFFRDMTDPADANTYPLAVLTKLGGDMQTCALIIYGSVALMEVVAASLAGAADGAADALSHSLAGLVGAGAAKAVTRGIVEAVHAFIASPVTSILTTMAGLLFMGSLVMKYYLPMLPFVRVAHAVLTWMISVFEAVALVPVAALAHLTTEGEGIAGSAKHAWILWLNVLLRPTLTVVGFVAALLCFNTFVVFLHEAFNAFMQTGQNRDSGGGIFGPTMYTVIYVIVIYTAANTCFKLLDLMPAAMFKWIGGGQADHSFDQENHGSAFNAIGGLSQALGARSMRGMGGAGAGGAGKDAGANAAASKKMGSLTSGDAPKA